MQERLAGRATEALREESRGILAEVTRRAMGAPPESGKAAPPRPAVELKQRANDLLRSILGGRKPATPPESAARESARTVRDTTKK